MYGGYMPQGYYDQRGVPTSYQAPSGPVGPPQYQGYVQTQPHGGMMNGNMPYEYSNMRGTVSYTHLTLPTTPYV